MNSPAIVQQVCAQLFRQVPLTHVLAMQSSSLSHALPHATGGLQAPLLQVVPPQHSAFDAQLVRHDVAPQM